MATTPSQVEMERVLTEIRKMNAETAKLYHEDQWTQKRNRWETWRVAFAGMTAGAALFAAGAAVGGLAISWLLKGSP